MVVLDQTVRNIWWPDKRFLLFTGLQKEFSAFAYKVLEMTQMIQL